MVYLDRDVVVNAAATVNLALLDRGYITDKLRFNTVDREELELPEFEVTETIYNNDKDTINIIYSLLKLNDDRQEQARKFNKRMAEHESELALLRREVGSLRKQLLASEAETNRLTQVELPQRELRVNELTRVNKLQAQEVARLKTLASDIKQKYQVELKKKNSEVAQLKDRLLEDSNLGLSPLGAIRDHLPRFDNASAPSVSIENVLTQELEATIEQLTELLTKLSEDNAKYAEFVRAVTGHLSRVSTQLSRHGPLPSVSDEIDLDKIRRAAALHEEFERIATPLLNALYKLHRHLDVGEVPENAEIDTLRRENRVLQNNWQTALDSIDQLRRQKASV